MGRFRIKIEKGPWLGIPGGNMKEFFLRKGVQTRLHNYVYPYMARGAVGYGVGCGHMTPDFGTSVFGAEFYGFWLGCPDRTQGMFIPTLQSVSRLYTKPGFQIAFALTRLCGEDMEVCYSKRIHKKFSFDQVAVIKSAMFLSLIHI